MKLLYTGLLTLIIVLAGNSRSFSQSTTDLDVNSNPSSDSSKIVIVQNYSGLFYLDFVFVQSNDFPSWTASQNSMTFDEYVAVVKNWIIANPSLYAQMISNRTSYTRITSENMMTFDGDRAQRIKESNNIFGTLILMQKKINENFPSVSEVQNQIEQVVYYTGLIHQDDLHFFQ